MPTCCGEVAVQAAVRAYAGDVHPSTPRAGGDGEPACRRGSVPRALAVAGWWPSICAVHLGRSTGPVLPRSTLLRVGVAEPPGSPPTLVRSYRTVSPLPVPGRPGHRRSALCCPVPTGHPVLALASTLPCGAPTFLDVVTSPTPRPPGRLTVPASVPRQPPDCPPVAPPMQVHLVRSWFLTLGQVALAFIVLLAALVWWPVRPGGPGWRGSWSRWSWSRRSVRRSEGCAGRPSSSTAIGWAGGELTDRITGWTRLSDVMAVTTSKVSSSISWTRLRRCRALDARGRSRWRRRMAGPQPAVGGPVADARPDRRSRGRDAAVHRPLLRPAGGGLCHVGGLFLTSTWAEPRLSRPGPQASVSTSACCAKRSSPQIGVDDLKRAGPHRQRCARASPRGCRRRRRPCARCSRTAGTWPRGPGRTAPVAARRRCPRRLGHAGPGLRGRCCRTSGGRRRPAGADRRCLGKATMARRSHGGSKATALSRYT